MLQCYTSLQSWCVCYSLLQPKSEFADVTGMTRVMRGPQKISGEAVAQFRQNLYFLGKKAISWSRQNPPKIWVRPFHLISKLCFFVFSNFRCCAGLWSWLKLTEEQVHVCADLCSSWSCLKYTRFADALQTVDLGYDKAVSMFRQFVCCVVYVLRCMRSPVLLLHWCGFEHQWWHLFPL